MSGVANEDELVVVPALADYPRKVQPRRATQVRGVALQSMPVQVAAKELLAERHRLRGVELIEAVRQPGFLAGLDADGREGLAELVGVDLKPAVRRPLEGEGKGRERLCGAQPDKAAFTLVDVGLKDVRVLVAGAAVQAIGGDDQVRVGELALVLDFVPETLVHAQLMGALLQDLQQFLTADAAEAMATADELAATEMNGNIVPVMEVRQDRAVRLRIGGAEIPHGLIGEHHSPAERVVRPVALVDLDPRGR